MPCFHGRCTSELIDFIENASSGKCGMFFVGFSLFSLFLIVDLGVRDPDLSRVSLLCLPRHVDNALPGPRHR